jgi:hypothetical protein
MVPNVLLNNTTAEDRRVIRRWRVCVVAFYSVAALALVLISAVIHQRPNTIEAMGVSDRPQATLFSKD